MSVRMMVSKESAYDESGILRDNVEVVTNYNGHEPGMCHTVGCCHHDGQTGSYTFDNTILEKAAGCIDGCWYRQPLYMERTYVGAVLSERERNMRDDSDFYAVVWDEATQSIKEIQFASTRGWSYPNGAFVDATEEVKVKARRFLAEQKFARLMEEDRARAKAIRMGDTVVFLAEAKMKKEGITAVPGDTGEVFWMGVDSRRSTVFGAKYRIGVRFLNGSRMFVSDDKLEVTNWTTRLDGEDSCRRRAIWFASHDSVARISPSKIAA